MTREYGKSSRTYKTAIVWCVAGNSAEAQGGSPEAAGVGGHSEPGRHPAARRWAACELAENVDLARRSIKEAVWQAYNTIVVLAKDNQLKVVDMGLLHSSSADSLPGLILKHLIDAGDVEKGVSPNFLIRKWPGFVEWSTKSVRDAFYASPLFPRLLNAEGVKETIARGVTEGLLAYVGKKGHGLYEPFIFNKPMRRRMSRSATRFTSSRRRKRRNTSSRRSLASVVLSPTGSRIQPGARIQFRAEGRDQHGRAMALANAEWTATGGTVEQNGSFTAGDAEGSFQIEVAAGEIKGAANVNVANSPSPRSGAAAAIRRKSRERRPKRHVSPSNGRATCHPRNG